MAWVNHPASPGKQLPASSRVASREIRQSSAFVGGRRVAVVCARDGWLALNDGHDRAPLRIAAANGLKHRGIQIRIS